LKPLVISDPARVEFREITIWYRDREGRVAARFTAEARRVLALIERVPQIGSRVSGVEEPSVREMSMRKFPYRVVFADLGDHIHVLAFAHKRRGPEYFVERLRKL
jgi:toxin ParE1/3/4